MRYFIYFVITLFWLITTGIYVEREFFKDQPQKKKTNPLRQIKEETIRLKITKNGAPIGFQETRYIPHPDQTYTMRVTMAYQMLFPPVDMKLKSLIIMGKNGLPQYLGGNISVKTPMTPGRVSFDYRGKPKGKHFILTVYKGSVELLKQKLKEDQIPQIGQSPFTVIPSLEVGASWESQVNGGFFQAKYRLKILEKTTYRYEGEEHEAYVIEARMVSSPTGPMKAWVDKEGKVFRVEQPDGTVMVRVPPKGVNEDSEEDSGR